ncbi:GroES-like protein [Thozetella sp. PMI_491]|nr:GroES-like protein [Thozetella sp. PMI_491]
MATQAAVTIAGVNAPYTVGVVPRPVPGPKQILVKSIITGANPVEPFMHHTGLLVLEWPAVLGCEASGVVIELGEGVTKLQVGDRVLGCTRVGQNQYSTFQETFLMDEDTSVKFSNLTLEQASTLGVALYTSALGLISGNGITLPAPGTVAEKKDEWVIVIGASGSVGQLGVQLAHLAGYKVLASCSPSKDAIPKKFGAEATLNNRLSIDEQLAVIKEVTGGNFGRVFDASAQGFETATKALSVVSTAGEKTFSTVDDWTEMKIPDGIKEYRIRLGLIGRFEDPTGAEETKNMASWVPTFEGHIAAGTILPLDYELVDGEGLEKVIEAVALLEAGKFSKKLTVVVQQE